MKLYLIQRGTVQKGTTFDKFGSLIHLDYMGAAQFEFGALPDSAKHIQNELPIYSIRFSGVADVWLFSTLPQFEELETIIKNLAKSDNGYELHERTDLAKSLEGKSDINFWWDIENHWMAIRGQQNAVALEKVIRAMAIRNGRQTEQSLAPAWEKHKVECCGRYTYWKSTESKKICPKCKQEMKMVDPVPGY